MTAKFSATHLDSEMLEHFSHCRSEGLLLGEAQIPQPVADDFVAIVVDVELQAIGRLACTHAQKSGPILHISLAGLQATVIAVAAWKLGAWAIRGEAEERKGLALAGGLLV